MNWDWEKLREQQKKNKKSSPGGGNQGGDGGGGLEPPNFEDLFEQFKKFRFAVLFIALLIFVIIVLPSIFYKIEPNEVGVIQRFGEYVRETQPGPHFKWPNGIEKLTKVKVQYVYKEEFGYSPVDTMMRQKDRVEDVSLMLTGDLNVALVPWLVQYKIEDPVKYLFKVEDAKGLLRDLSEASMRLVVGDRSVNEVIINRDEIAIACKKNLQVELDKAGTGILIKNVEMKKTNVPGKVQPSFNEVNKAQQIKETMIYKAKEEYNKAIPAALGVAKKTVLEAEGYATDRINRAKGDASRFLQVYSEYLKAKDVTKRRLYIEKLSKIYPKIGKKYIVDEEQKGLLPLLNLTKAGGNK